MQSFSLNINLRLKYETNTLVVCELAVRTIIYHITTLFSNIIQPLRIFLSHTRVRKDFMTS